MFTDNRVNKACDKAIISISKGDKNALSVVYDCMAKMIMSVSYAITGNYSDAEDVLQETLISVLRYVENYQQGSNAKAWVLAMARHIAIDTVRKRRPAISIDDEEALIHPSTDSDYTRLEVLDLLKILEEEEKLIIIYRLYTGLSYAEISDVMEISTAAAQKKYQRALKKLKKSV